MYASCTGKAMFVLTIIRLVYEVYLTIIWKVYERYMAIV